MRKSAYKEIIDTVKKFGVNDYHIGYGGKHPYIQYEVKGKPFKYVLPSTPGGYRTMKNCVAGIRRHLRSLGMREDSLESAQKSGRKGNKEGKMESVFATVSIRKSSSNRKTLSLFVYLDPSMVEEGAFYTIDRFSDSDLIIRKSRQGSKFVNYRKAKKEYGRLSWALKKLPFLEGLNFDPETSIRFKVPILGSQSKEGIYLKWAWLHIKKEALESKGEKSRGVGGNAATETVIAKPGDDGAESKHEKVPEKVDIAGENKPSTVTAEGPKNTIQDLKDALEMINEMMREIGAEPMIDESGKVKARIII